MEQENKKVHIRAKVPVMCWKGRCSDYNNYQVCMSIVPHGDARPVHHTSCRHAGKDAETRTLTEAKVTQLDSALVVHQHVLRLHISVDNASVMDVVKCCHQLLHDMVNLTAGQTLGATLGIASLSQCCRILFFRALLGRAPLCLRCACLLHRASC